MKFLIMFLLLTSLCYAEEFKTDKPFDAGELVKEIELSTELDLEGEDQIGYMNTSNNTVEIKLRDRELTQIEKDKIAEIITNHNVSKVRQDKKVKKEQKKEAIKLKLNLSEQDFKNLKEALGD